MRTHVPWIGLIVAILAIASALPFVRSFVTEMQHVALIRMHANDTALTAVALAQYRAMLNDQDAFNDPQSYTIDTIRTQIDIDDSEDATVVVHSDATCGNAGCIALILLQTSAREFTPVAFGYAVTAIEVLGSITNGMHDIRINHDETTRLTWDGAQYVLESL